MPRYATSGISALPLLAGLLVLPVQLYAGCACGSGGSSYVGARHGAAGHHGSTGAMTPIPEPTAAGPPATVTVAPPPGNLGRTYLGTTRYIPDDKHPRVGMVELAVPAGLKAGQPANVKLKITVQDTRRRFKKLEGFERDEDGKWVFESKPLLPGIPHIYRVLIELVREDKEVEVRYGVKSERIIERKVGTVGERYLRLIPGRIIEYSW